MDETARRPDWWMASDGRWYPPQSPTDQPLGPVEQPLVHIGDIAVSQSWVVTPQGNRPVRDVTWSVTDLSRTYRTIPAWAIVATIIGFFFFLLGLLFLLVKETKTEGWIQVSVQAPGFMHTTSIPVHSPAQVADIHGRVNYARSLTAHAQPPGLSH
jgi:hypothetical protein